MIPIILYCSSVFTILLLYYFYKPADESQVESKHQQDQYKSQFSTGTVGSVLSNDDSTLNNNNSTTANNNNDVIVMNNNKKLLVQRKFNLIRCDSNISIQTSTSNSNNEIYNSIFTNTNNSSFNTNNLNSADFNNNLFKKLVFYFRTYILVYLIPIYKYLGLNDSSLNLSNQNLNSNHNTTLNRIVESTNSYQIEDNYKTLDDLLAELNKLDILNYQQNVNDSLFNFDTTSLLNASIQNHHDFSCNIIIGVDFTASNEWKGRKTFNSQSLHKTLGNKIYNPYQKVISVLGFVVNKLITSGLVSSLPSSSSTVTSSINGQQATFSNSWFNTGLRIYAYGFGDQTTTDKSVFSFFDYPTANPDNSNQISTDYNYVESFEEVLTKYNEIVKRINLSGPTSFAPIIYKSIEIMKHQQLLNYQRLQSFSMTQPDQTVKIPYHILFIIADGKVSDEDENDTIKAIIDASNYPLSIVVIGVGDGPWNTMIKFDNRLCTKSKFDNFQFVDYYQTVKNSKTPDLAFALKALMEVPDQYKIMKQFNYV